MKKGGSLFRFIRSSGIFLLGTVSSKMINFLMLPLYTSLIPSDDMGYYDLSITYMNIAVSVLFFQIWAAVLRYMYDSCEKERKFSVAKSGLIIFAASSGVFVIGITLTGVIWDVAYWYLLGIYGILECLVYLYTFFARGLNHNADFAISGVIAVFVNACVNIVHIVVFGIGFEAMYYGYISGALVQITYLELRVGFLRKTLFAKIEKGLTKQMLVYALPLCLGTVAYWMLTGFNKIAVNICLGDSANGIYAIGSRFGTLVSFVTICFTYAWQDLSFSKANDVDDRSEFYSKAYNIYSKFLLTGMLLLLPVCYWMFIIMINGDYVEAIITVPTFLCVAVLSALTSFVENVFYAIKDTKTLLVSTLIAAIVNVALVFPLVNLFGINGANYAAIIAFAVNLIIRCIVLKKKIKFKSRWLTQVVLMVIWIFEHILFEDMGHIESLILLLVNIAISVVLFRKDVLHFLNINTSIDKNAG